MTNLCLLGGATAPADLIASVDKGLYVSHLGGGSFLPDSDLFELYISEAHCIEKGRLTCPIQGLTLRGSRTGFLQHIRGIGADARADPGTVRCKKNEQVVPVSICTPTVLVESLEAVPSRERTDA